MQKVFWLINQYSSTPDIGIGGRHYYIAEELSNLGYKVYLITSSYNHLQRLHPKHKHDYYIETINSNFNIVWIKVPEYPHAHSKIRIYNWFLFSCKLTQLIKQHLAKPDVIYYSSPSPFGYFGSRYLANKYQVPLIFEVRDLWPLTLTELGGLSTNHPFIKFMQWVEDKAYQKSDFIFSNLLLSVEHIKNRGGDEDKFYWIPNGFSLREMKDIKPLTKDILKMIPQDKFIIGYTGTIGVANATDDLIKAADILHKYKKLHFLIVGDGKEKTNLKNLAQDKKLDNITFINSIPKKQVQSIIKHFNICFLGSQNKNIYRFGVAPNKIPEYLYSGKPIIFAYSGNGDPIESNKAGLTVEAGSPEAIANAILEIYSLPLSQQLKMGDNGHNLAINKYEYKSLAEKIAKIIFN